MVEPVLLVLRLAGLISNQAVVLSNDRLYLTLDKRK